jgi:hypothetical protein
MTKELIGALAITLVAVIAVAIYLSNRQLRKKQETAMVQPASFLDEGTKAFYVATVYAEKPLDRIWAYGLGVRGNGSISVIADGVGITRVGAEGFFIPAESLEGVGLQSATIDKGVERDGLLAIDWKLGETSLTTILRINDSSTKKKVVFEIEKLIGVAVG